MESKLYSEMQSNLIEIDKEIGLSDKNIFIFGHCSATLKLIDFMEERGYSVKAILDNNRNKHGLLYKRSEVISPERIILESAEDHKAKSIVLITSRHYASMHKQLREIGYSGPIRKLVDYNTFADYSLSKETIDRMTLRVQHGKKLIRELDDRYGSPFKVFCPFNALGDVYIMMSYWNAFASRRGIKKAVFCVPGKTLSDIIKMFDDYPVEVYEQKDLDAIIQAVIYTNDRESFIAHQDRPYVINLAKALYIKKIPLEQMYCCGVFGLPPDTVPDIPVNGLREYSEIENIPEGKSIIFSPYAKSVPTFNTSIWNDAVSFYKNRGYMCFTNVGKYEAPLSGTDELRIPLPELISAIERAGTFIGIRSGLCDVIKTAKCRKIALYPDYYYCDTKWKAIDMYYIGGFENVLMKEGDTWEALSRKMKL